MSASGLHSKQSWHEPTPYFFAAALLRTLHDGSKMRTRHTLAAQYVLRYRAIRDSLNVRRGSDAAPPS